MRTSGAGVFVKLSFDFPSKHTGSKVPLAARISKRRAQGRVAKQARKVNRGR